MSTDRRTSTAVGRFSSWAALLLVSVLWAVAAGCAKGNGSTETPDMTGRRICPDNPGLCAGTCCGTECIGTQADPRNCGACGTQCGNGTVCANGQCGCLPTGAACGQGQSCCGTAGCKSLDSDINNCGACGKRCGDGSTCAGGLCKCGTVTCGATETCCNGACAAVCASNPDMAMPACACGGGCLFNAPCVANNCCIYESSVFGGSCDPDPTCVISSF